MSWNVGVSTGIGYREPIEEVLPGIAAGGFRAIEVATARPHIDLRDSERFARVREQADRLGLRVHSLHAPFGQGIDLTDPDAGIRRLSLRVLREAADFLRALGGELYVIHPGGEDHNWVWEREQRLGRSVEGLTEIWGICRERGLKLVVETPLPHLLGGSLSDFGWILARIPPDTGVCVDTSHTSLAGTLFEAIDRFSERLVHLQASDNYGKHDDHFPPGEGVIDWQAVLNALERARYRGLFLFETGGEGPSTENVKRLAHSVSRLFPRWQPKPAGDDDRKKS